MLSFNRFRHARRSAEKSEPRSLRERGAAALEFALIAPFFFLVVFGGIEIGFMFRNHLALQDTVRSAARVAAVERNAVDADQEILRKINARVGELNGDVTRVVIFAAPTLNSAVPTICTTGGTNSTANCNVYTVTDGNVQAIIDSFPAPPAADPRSIGIDRASERRPLDNIGIYVEYEYQYVTGFFDKITLSASSVQVIELDL